MARERISINDRLREIRKTDPNRLDESRVLADKILSFPAGQDKPQNGEKTGTPL